MLAIEEPTPTEKNVDIPENAFVVSPGESIQQAIDKAMQASSNSKHPPTVLLRDGTHYLESTLMIGPQHSGLVIQG